MTRGEASTSRRAPSRSWLLSRLGVLFCIAAAFAAVTALAKGRREALWQVVQLCVANHNWTGASFPCLTVNTSDGEERGYIVLRRPVGRPDTILAPTRKITGLEDPLLRSSETPNYFLDAWNERTLVSDRIQRPLAHEQVALAVNSRYTRTQDQFHIHIGCVDREASEILDTISPDLSANRWVRARKRFYGFDIWGLQIAKETLDGVNPVRTPRRRISGREREPGPEYDRARRRQTPGWARRLRLADMAQQLAGLTITVHRRGLSR